MTSLPLIIGAGGINSGGISSTAQSYRNMVAPNLSIKSRDKLYKSLAALIGESESGINKDPSALASKFFIRKITRPDLFNPADTPYYQTNRKVEKFPISFAACLPDGFTPNAHYEAKNHPRALQMAVFGANDALNSAGLDIEAVNQNIAPDKLGVYCGSALGQLDYAGMGGVLSAMLKQERTVTKQLPFSYPQMTADFINAYIINNLGQTGNCCGACATFLYNLSLAVTNIKLGKIELAIVGASEAPILPQLICAFYNMGAMTSDSKVSKDDFSKASLPFGNNFGFVMGESAQFIVLASEEAAYKLGSVIHGAVPDVFISADGAKRSISSPGPGNYITVAKALAAAGRILGDKKVAKSSYVHAHGTSTPQNRLTESQILSTVAKHFKINDWPVVAVKSYLGHSQATAGGDQIMAALGYWQHSILPGITTIDDVADDVETTNLRFNLKHTETAPTAMDISFINAKGFGGNNATAILFSPDVAQKHFRKVMGSRKLRKNTQVSEQRQKVINQYLNDAESGKFRVRYELAQAPPIDKDISLQGRKIIVNGYPPIDI